MIERYYKNINILRFVEGDFETPSKYEVVRSFKGLIQAPSNSKTFNNNKDTSNVAGVLSCSASVKFDAKDIIEYKGNKYIISGQGSQPDGVCGIAPGRGQHAEYHLNWVQKNV